MRACATRAGQKQRSAAQRTAARPSKCAHLPKVHAIPNEVALRTNEPQLADPQLADRGVVVVVTRRARGVGEVR